MRVEDLVPLRVAAEMLGVGVEQVRRYIQRGVLPGDKFGSVWLTSAAHVRALEFAPPRAGRPLTADAAWDAILAGDIDLNDPWRYANRGRLSRWAASWGAVGDLVCRSDIIVSGVHAARVFGALMDPAPKEAHVYVPESALQRTRDDLNGALSCLVPYGFGTVQVHAVPDSSWDRVVAACPRVDEYAAPRWATANTRYVPKSAVALDLVVSPYAREQDIADALMT